MPDTTHDTSRALETLRASFDRACDALGLSTEGRAAIFDDLRARLGEPHRHYHDAHHVAACVTMAEAHASHAPHPHDVVLALLFHDAIYDPRANDNEARSAELADAALTTLGATKETRARVRGLVMATAGHEAGVDRDAQLVLAADLAILGSDETTFALFETQIREEYAFVPDDAYRAGRARVLASFVLRPRIYAVPAIGDAREARARTNLERAIARLTT